MKSLKIAGNFVISLVLAVILLKVLSGYVNQQYLIPYLIRQVEKKTNNRYTLTIQDETVSAGLFTIDLIIGHTEFKRDSSQNRNSGIDLLDKFDVFFSFDSLEISVPNPLSYLFNKKIKIRQVELINPIYTVRKNIAYTPEESADTAAVSVPENIQDADSVTIHADTTVWSDNSAEPIANSTEFIANSTKTIANSTESISNSTESISNSTESISNSTELIANSTKSIANSTECIAYSAECIANSAKHIANSAECITNCTE